MLSPEEIKARLAGLTPAARSSQGIQADGSRLRGDHDLAPELYPGVTLRQAAVLVPLILGLGLVVRQDGPGERRPVLLEAAQ